MQRRDYLSLMGVGAATAIAGCSSTTDSDGNGDGDQNNSNSSNESEQSDLQAIPATYNVRRYDRLTTPDSEGVYYESDSEEHYVGVQLKVKNTTEETINMTAWDLMLSVDGTTDGVTIHAQSKAGALEEIPAGDTVETWLFYTAPPEGDLGLKQTDTTDYEFDITHDPNLELAFSEFQG